MRRDESGDYTLLKNEKLLYNEMLYKCASDFTECTSHLEKLTIMQHYGLPSRLLDITSNSLVALYFECGSSRDSFGEVVIINTNSEKIKWPMSDTVSLLASMPALTYEDNHEIAKKALNMKSKDAVSAKEFFEYRSVHRLLAEVGTEKPNFKDSIIASDLLGFRFVYAVRNNARINKQSGAFINCGEPYPRIDDNHDAIRHF